MAELKTKRYSGTSKTKVECLFNRGTFIHWSFINSTTIKIILQKRKTIHFTFRCIDQWTKLRRAVHVNMQMARCTPAPRVSPPPPILQDRKYGQQKFSRQE